MKTQNLLVVVACVGIFGGCATVPMELVNAREANERANRGPTARMAPAQVHVANQALAQAEYSFRQNDDSYQTRDLAYVAQRKAEIAEATAAIHMEQNKQTRAEDNFQATQSKIIVETKEDLSRTRTALAVSEHSGDVAEHRLSDEKEARAIAEQQAADAQAALAELAAVKDEPRGMVITLSGSVLFASNQATLLPMSRSRLDKVANVLLTTRERHLAIEGHTDSQGSGSHNQDLSQRRADAVRDYLVQRGYQADRIQTHGFGEERPLTDNGNAEGRANNRRVEIVVERQGYTSTP